MHPLPCCWASSCHLLSLTCFWFTHCPGRFTHTAGKLAGPHEEGSSGGSAGISPYDDDDDIQSVFSHACATTDSDSALIFQNMQRLTARDDLFYTSVVIHDAVELRAMLDSGSMACSLSSRLLPNLLPNSL